MTVHGTLNLPFSNGTICVGGHEGHVCVVTIFSTRPPTPIFVYPFVPSYKLGYGDAPLITDNGARILRQLGGGAEVPVTVEAGYDLLAALLCSGREGLTVSDLGPDTLRYNCDEGHTLELDADRLGLKRNSKLWFKDNMAGKIRFHDSEQAPSPQGAMGWRGNEPWGRD